MDHVHNHRAGLRRLETHLVGHFPTNALANPLGSTSGTPLVSCQSQAANDSHDEHLTIPLGARPAFVRVVVIDRGQPTVAVDCAVPLSPSPLGLRHLAVRHRSSPAVSFPSSLPSRAEDRECPQSHSFGARDALSRWVLRALDGP